MPWLPVFFFCGLFFVFSSRRRLQGRCHWEMIKIRLHPSHVWQRWGLKFFQPNLILVCWKKALVQMDPRIKASRNPPFQPCYWFIHWLSVVASNSFANLTDSWKFLIYSVVFPSFKLDWVPSQQTADGTVCLNAEVKPIVLIRLDFFSRDHYNSTSFLFDRFWERWPISL